MDKKNTPKWFYAVLILIPVIFIVLLELTLLAIGYGNDFSQWTEITDTKLILNPDIGARYFSNVKDYPYSNHDPFDKIKTKNAFRVFVFGGSSTAGFPFQPNGNFSRYIRDRLNLVYPNRNIEVINLGITATNTYTILDLLPGVIEQNPDLVIIYSGHNEFYGALGVGSTESVGNYRALINLYLHVNKFRTTQLLKNIITHTLKIFGTKKENFEGTTLMARMASEKAIKINSATFNKGVDQFENNLDQILSSLNNANIPTIIGTLTSNLLDQKPFVTFEDEPKYSANQYFLNGLALIKQNNVLKGDSLLKLAKDFDGLRFRAPSVFNKIIKLKAQKYNCSLIDIDSIFNRISQFGVVGNNLMVDHLHPNLKGHFIIGSLFYNKMIENELLPFNKLEVSDEEPNNIVIKNFAFSELDSVAASYRIFNLLNDWPFTNKKDPNLFNKIQITNKIDSIAFKIVKQNLNWEIAHQLAYKYYLSRNELKKFVKEINVLISQYPYKLTYYNYAAQELILRKHYEEAELFLTRRYKTEPDDFSTKWLGSINLFRNNFEQAIKYLKESIKINPNDAQIFYNLTIAYLKIAENEQALNAISNCLRLNVDYPNAQRLFNQLSHEKKSRLN